jgi:glycosyltransferase involved in cell wall biosynthesis
VALALRFSKKPYILVLHGGRLPEFARRWPGRVRRLLSQARVVVTPSRMLQSAFQPIRPDIAWIPNGIHLDRYPFRLRQQAQPRLVWLRAFHQIYDPGLAVRVLAGILPANPEATLTMIGPDKGGGSLQAVKNLAEALGVAGRLHIPGAIAKQAVPEWLSRSDIFINTTRYESFGVAVVEAAACGLCIATTDAGELPLIWRDGEEVLFSPVGDAHRLTANVCKILTNPVDAARLSKHAQRRAAEYDWRSILPRWEELFMKIVRQSGIWEN